MINIKKDVFSISDKGLVRQANEDNCGFADTPNGYLFVVCDGMGGHAGGATASKIAVDTIIDYFVRDLYQDLRAALANALDSANMQIIATAQANPELKGMGTTACVILIKENQVWLAHAGDSRIYFFCNQQKWLYRITKDHSYVQGLVDQGFISDTEAEHHPDKNRIVKALGIKEDLHPEVCQKPVLPANNDIFLICSDGLSGMVSDDDMQHVLSQNSSLEEKGNLLITLAKQAGGNDNITVQLIRISQSPHSNSVFESKNPVERIFVPKQRRQTMSVSKPTKKSDKTVLFALIIGIVLIAGILAFVLYNKYSISPSDTNQTEKVDDKPLMTEAKTKDEKAWVKEVNNSEYNQEIDLSMIKFSGANRDVIKIFNKNGTFSKGKQFKGTVVRSNDSCEFEKNITITQEPNSNNYGIIIE